MRSDSNVELGLVGSVDFHVLANPLIFLGQTRKLYQQLLVTLHMFSPFYLCLFIFILASRSFIKLDTLFADVSRSPR